MCVCLGFDEFGKVERVSQTSCVRETMIFVWGEERYDLGPLINKN